MIDRTLRNYIFKINRYGAHPFQFAIPAKSDLFAFARENGEKRTIRMVTGVGRYYAVLNLLRTKGTRASIIFIPGESPVANF